MNKKTINEFNKAVLGMNKIRDFLLALDRLPPQGEQAKAQAIEEVEILDGEAPDEWYLNSPYFDFNEYGVNRYILRRMLQAERKKINQKLLPLFKEIGFNHYAISARFSNGETWYSKVA